MDKQVHHNRNIPSSHQTRNYYQLSPALFKRLATTYYVHYHLILLLLSLSSPMKKVFKWIEKNNVSILYKISHSHTKQETIINCHQSLFKRLATTYYVHYHLILLLLSLSSPMKKVFKWIEKNNVSILYKISHSHTKQETIINCHQSLFKRLATTYYVHYHLKLKPFSFSHAFLDVQTLL